MSSYPTNARSGRGVECGGRWSNRMWASYIKRGSEGKWAGAALPHRSLLDPLAATSIHDEPSPVQGILSWQPRTRHPRQRVITDCHGVALKTFMSAVSLSRYMANCCHGNLKMLSFWPQLSVVMWYRCHGTAIRGPARSGGAIRSVSSSARTHLLI